jgi:hypothetical protein
MLTTVFKMNHKTYRRPMLVKTSAGDNQEVNWTDVLNDLERPCAVADAFLVNTV